MIILMIPSLVEEGNCQYADLSKVRLLVFLQLLKVVFLVSLTVCKFILSSVFQIVLATLIHPPKGIEKEEARMIPCAIIKHKHRGSEPMQNICKGM